MKSLIVAAASFAAGTHPTLTLAVLEAAAVALALLTARSLRRGGGAR